MIEVNFDKLCLASQSPRRQALLRQIGVTFEVIPANIDERRWPQEAPADYVRRMSLTKAETMWHNAGYSQRWPVLASDTAVVLDNEVLGKPSDEAEGKAMLRALSGKWHQVVTGVALVYRDRQSYLESTSRVLFRPLSEADIDLYWSTGEGSDKAGCYAVQGFAAAFIQSIEGSYSGIMGLPLFETCRLLEQWRIAYWPQRQTPPPSSSETQ